MKSLISRQKGFSASLKKIHIWFARQLDDEKPKGMIAALDGIRALACILVVVYHSTGVVVGRWGIYQVPIIASLNNLGAKGVTLFFVLSGLLLFLPYAQALLFEKRWPQARIFYLRRVLRIVPGYYFALFALILLEKPYNLQPHNWKALLFALTFLMHGSQISQFNTIYWTLPIEFQFYMVLPLIALGIYGLTRLVPAKMRLYAVTGLLFALIAWGLGTRDWGYAFFSNPGTDTFLAAHPLQKTFIFMIYGLDSTAGKYFEDFATGMLLATCYVVVTQSSRGERYQRLLQRLSPWLWWLGIALLLFATWRYQNFFPNWQAGTNVIYAYPAWANEFTFALGFACCIQAILYNGTGLLKRFFEWTPLRWLGLISFSLYLWHGPLIVALSNNLAPALFREFRGIVAVSIFAVVEILVVLPISFMLYVMVEKPGMHLSERLRNNIQKRWGYKEPAQPRDLLLQDEKFDSEKTEPRQPAIIITKGASL